MENIKFVISSYDYDNKSNVYIGNGNKPTVTKILKQARIFNSYEKAVSFISNLPKTLKVNKLWEVQEVTINSQGDIKLKNLKELLSLNIKHYDNELVDLNNDYYDDLKNLLTELLKLRNDLSDLENQQHIIELKINDYQHYIEFNKLNACEGYCAYDEMKKLYMNRRQIKNNINKIKLLLKLFNDDVDLESLDRKFKEIDNQKYSPRILFELFN